MVSQISQDPLAALGTSVFMEIASYLAFDDILHAEMVCHQWQDSLWTYGATLWKRLCEIQGIDEEKARKRQVARRHLMGLPQRNDTINWREELRACVDTDRSWNNGEMRQRWIVPGDNSVHRFKIDHERGNVISSSSRGGLYVSNVYTSQPLFSLPNVRSFAHVEFANGYVVFDQDEQLNELHVYSSHRGGLDDTTPLTDTRNAHLGQRLVSGESEDGAGNEGAQGSLYFRRIIRLPARYRAFRVRTDYEGYTGQNQEGEHDQSRKQRTMLAAAGQGAVHLWDLEDPQYTETIPTDISLDEIRYIEFDEDHVFICIDDNFMVYSRKTRERVLAFLPDEPMDAPGSMVLVEQGDRGQPRQYRRAEDVPGLSLEPCPSSVSVLKGTVKTPDSDPLLLLKCLSSSWEIELNGGFFFKGCHFNDKDLFIATTWGIVVVRDYRVVLSATTPVEQRALLNQHVLWIAPHDQSIDQIAVEGNRVAFSGRSSMFGSRIGYFNTRDLATLPVLAGSEQVPAMPIFFCEMVNERSADESQCLQVDEGNIYAVYSTRHDAGMVDPVTNQYVPIPAAASQGNGCCIRVWKFGLQ